MKYTGRSPLIKNGFIITVTLGIIFSALAIGCVSALYNPNIIFESDRLDICVTLSIAALICAVALFFAFHDAERYFSVITIDSKGITSTCVFQSHFFISWEEITDCGICIDKESNKNEYKMLYVSDAKLSPNVKMGRRRKTRKTLPDRFCLIPCNKETIDIILSFANSELCEKLTNDIIHYRLNESEN